MSWTPSRCRNCGVEVDHRLQHATARLDGWLCTPPPPFHPATAPASTPPPSDATSPTAPGTASLGKGEHTPGGAA